MATPKYTRAIVEAALKKHDTRVAVANSLGCSNTYVNTLLEIYRDLKPLAKWKDIKVKKDKIWGRY